MIKTITNVTIKATTWSKNAQGLFDYESSHVSEKVLEASSTTNIFRAEDDVLLEEHLEDKANLPSSAQTLICLKRNKDSFFVERVRQPSANTQERPENIWQVVKSVNPSNTAYKGYLLSEGDIIKLGKIKLRVRELKSFANVPQQNQNFKNLEEEKEKSDDVDSKSKDFIQRCAVKKPSTGEEAICKICLETEVDEENPLVTPCSCTGSVRHVHLQCLRQWIESKCFSKTDECCTMYMWRDLECELCHQPLPDVFLQEGKEIELLNIIRPTDTYVILETLPEKKQIKKVFYVASFTKDNRWNLLKVGRKSDCEIKVNDISVSRLHAMLRHFDGTFYLENGFSKFGTLVLFKNEAEIKKGCVLALQMGRTVLSFELTTKEVVVEPEPVVELPSALPVEPECEKKEEEKPQEPIEESKEDETYLFRKISDASTELTQTNCIYSHRGSLSDLSTSPSFPTSANSPLIDGNQIKNDLEYLDKLLFSIKEFIEDRSKMMAEIARCLNEPLNVAGLIEESSREQQSEFLPDRT